ncbi:Spc97/Spc98 family protein [Colletotrichum abscissum]|uniref:Spc97/Spc98 family protein n=1 Tax=Colletotrichum abscissum TaxID=1671311 RepID=UPI0027D5120B|nr:Spc97/Spc98 family protein [Colletotrichum abscissum]KAK1479463.1 Spc97/Spc98 family protein [Colletotrichum abscissum]
MFEEDDLSNVFAIPDFRKPSKLLNDQLPRADTGFFALDLTAPELPSSCSPPDPQPSELFTLPAIDPAPQQEESNTDQIPDFTFEEPTAEEEAELWLWEETQCSSPGKTSMKPSSQPYPGSGYRHIRFVDSTYLKNPTPCRVALASAVDKALLVIQSSVALHHQHPRSILQVQSLVAHTYTTLRQFESLVSKIRRDHLDEDVFVIVFQQAQSAEYAETHLRDMMREVLRRVSKPWIELVEEWIGTRRELGVPLSKHEVGRQKGFIKVESETHMDDFGDEVDEVDFRLDTERIPSFMPEDVVKSLFEVGRNLRFIRSNHPGHPLSQESIISSSRPPTVEWLFDWDSVVQLEDRIRSYESAVLEAIKNFSLQGSVETAAPAWPIGNSATYQLQLFGLDENQLQSRLALSIQDFAKPIADSTSEDLLGIIIRDRLSDVTTEIASAGTDFTPHWSLLPILSFGSIISAQSRVVGRESLKLLFTSHNLREHLKLQKEFHLLGNGFFCSRLSHALFDPDLETAERQSGVAHQGGVMGLRLSGRDTWPPASSELRLALMGVLTESYEGSLHEDSRPRDGEKNELPGDLSFGVRSLSNEEIDKCMDPTGLEALDFLRLSYKSPAALGAIIAPVILVQYDRIFKLLLRVLRMQYTVNRIFRDVTARESGWQDVDDVSIRFCFEARHFVSSLSSYIFDIGIGMPWQAFEKLLSQIEMDLRAEDQSTVSTSVLSPDRLREHHSQVLDRIMLALLLRKRQQPVLKLLDDIFRVVLKFAQYSRLQNEGRKSRGQGDATAKGLYKMFKRNVEVFLAVCKGLSEKGDYGTKDTAGEKLSSGRVDALEGNPIAQLVLKLDISTIAEQASTMARPGPSARNLTLTEELEKLEQSITLTLQEIDHNFSKAHRIVTTNILPIVEQYGEHSRNVWDASKFWKQFFEASANVSLSGYEENANNGNDETGATEEESTVQEDTSVDYTRTPQQQRTEGEDMTIVSTADSTFRADDSVLDDNDLTGSTPRPPKTKTMKPQFSNLESPYETLKRELKGEPPAPHEEDDENEDLGLEEDSTVLFAQHTARLPDMSMTPRSSFAPPQQQQSHKDPLMHRMLDKTFRIQATPHKGPTYRVSPLKRDDKNKEKENVPAWQQDSPMSSPVMAVPKLRSEAFMSPIKSNARQRLAAATASAGPRTPGVSVQTPGGARKTKDVFATKGNYDDDTTTDLGAKFDKQRYEIDWESDSDEDHGLYGGMSPPKTIQFALPPSKLLQTPAREASKRIVDDILLTAGAEPESSEYSPTMVKMNEDILNESF